MLANCVTTFNLVNRFGLNVNGKEKKIHQEEMLVLSTAYFRFIILEVVANYIVNLERF